MSEQTSDITRQLMTHVEGIVRPIGASQRRKFRMRLELLAHLQATFEEELRDSPDDASAALDRATHRLGEPAELTRSLQQTVPTFERLLLSRIPLSASLEHAEQQMNWAVGQRGPMTISHGSVLVVAGSLLFVPYFVTSMRTATVGQAAYHFWQSLFGAIALLALLWFAAFRLVFGAAQNGRLQQPATLLRNGAAVVALQVALNFVATRGTADRLPTAMELSGTIASTITLLLMALAMARLVARLRRPYDAWLTLSVTQA